MRHETDGECFRGASVAEALAAVRARFGPDVEILRSKQTKTRGFEVWARRPVQGRLFPETPETALLREALASVRKAKHAARLSGGSPRLSGGSPRPDASRFDRTTAPEIVREVHTEGATGGAEERHVSGVSGLAAYRRAGGAGKASEAGGDASQPPTPSGIEALQSEVRTLRRDLAHLMRAVLGDRVDRRLTAALLEEGFSQDAAHRLAGCGVEPGTALSAAIGRWLRPIELAAGETPRVLLFAGPPGAGKTTTLAKIAARLRYDEGRMVSFVQTDFHRLGADAQLATYAELIGGRLVEASSVGAAAEAAVSLYRGGRVVLIDTPGRWGRRGEVLGDLAATIRAAGAALEVALCLPLTADRRIHDRAIEEVRRGESDVRLVWTMGDEAVRWGHAIEAAGEADAPIAFVTTGEGVPEDIEVADVGRITDACLARVLESLGR